MKQTTTTQSEQQANDEADSSDQPASSAKNENQPVENVEVVGVEMAGVTNRDESPGTEEDPFAQAQLPPRSPYRDPAVFKGHRNYGFECCAWEMNDKRDASETDNDNSD